MPVHPAIASLLAECRLSGWARTFGRTPEESDLVILVPPEPRRNGRVKAVGPMLDKDWI